MTDRIPIEMSVIAKDIIVILVASDESLIRGVMIKTGMFIAITSMVKNHMKKMFITLGSPRTFPENQHETALY